MAGEPLTDHPVVASSPLMDTVLAIAGLVNGYHNDGTTLTAAQTLRAIADQLGDPFVVRGAEPHDALAARLEGTIALHLDALKADAFGVDVHGAFVSVVRYSDAMHALLAVRHTLRTLDAAVP